MNDFAVLFLSETGNAALLAKEIYEYLPSPDKVLVDLRSETEIPKASFYFIGFDVRNDTCSLKVLNLLSELDEGLIALFATCAQAPTDEAKHHLEKKFDLWIEHEEQYAGMFLCQGRLPENIYPQYCDRVKATLPEEQAEEVLRQLEEGQAHPDEADYAAARAFVDSVVQFPL